MRRLWRRFLDWLIGKPQWTLRLITDGETITLRRDELSFSFDSRYGLTVETRSRKVRPAMPLRTRMELRHGRTLIFVGPLRMVQSSGAGVTLTGDIR